MSNTPLGLEFKSSTFSVPVLILSTENLDVIQQQLQDKVKHAPEFFKSSPLILDLQELNKSGYSMDVSVLVRLIRRVGMFPVGIRGGNVQQNKQAVDLLIPVYSIDHREVSSSKKEVAPAESAKPKEPLKVKQVSTTLITQPIRSGQRIYAEGDLVILAQVSAGAEILAEGNIHVYNSLRGRALAGVQGDESARIFCFDLAAELISVAGNYKVSEDLNHVVRNKPVQIYLQDQALIIKDIELHH